MNGETNKSVYPTFGLDFISHRRNFVLTCNLPDKGFVDLIRVFDSDAFIVGNEVNWITLRQKEPELTERIQSYIESFNEKGSSIKKLLYDFFNNLVDGECFFVLNHEQRSTSELLDLWCKLGQLNAKTINTSFDNNYYHWGTTVLNYNIDFYGTERKSFGQFKKSKIKICRFCRGKDGEDNSKGNLVTFGKKAHLISEALGNKRLISLDECDSCNEYFSRTIEPSIVNYFAPYRSLYGIPGKGGKKRLVGDDFELDAEDGFNIQFSGSIDDLSKENIKIPLSLKQTFIYGDLYRCLVKFILAVMPKEEMVNYSETIDWIFNTEGSDLPKVACLQSANFYTEHPYLVKYKRHTKDLKFPDLIGEFRYADILVIFIVPFSKLDKKQFLLEEEITFFWNTFIGLRRDYLWNFVDFSSMTPLGMEIDFKINGIELGKNAFLFKESEQK